MGSTCTKKKPNPEMKKIRVKALSKEEQILRKKTHLFQNEKFESNFMEFTTPRSGRHIKWKRGELLGEGSYAQVFQCMNTETGELMAVKHFNLSDNLVKLQREFSHMKKEVALLKSLDHANIVQYFQTDLSADMSGIDILLEYVPGGSLKYILQKYGKLEEDVIRNYAKQLIGGLEYLHEHGIVHRDLKSANVLITPKGNVKLTDFGSSRKLDSTVNSISRSMKGSPYWMAPEVVNRNGHSFPTDIWSFGCVLVEMLSGRPPWSNYSRDAREVLNLIKTPHKLPDIPKSSKALNLLITHCLDRNPANRPTAKKIRFYDFLV